MVTASILAKNMLSDSAEGFTTQEPQDWPDEVTEDEVIMAE